LPFFSFEKRKMIVKIIPNAAKKYFEDLNAILKNSLTYLIMVRIILKKLFRIRVKKLSN
jgi:hypothetical protein